jgi:hypothetical protein
MGKSAQTIDPKEVAALHGSTRVRKRKKTRKIRQNTVLQAKGRGGGSGVHRPTGNDAKGEVLTGCKGSAGIKSAGRPGRISVRRRRVICAPATKAQHAGVYDFVNINLSSLFARGCRRATHGLKGFAGALCCSLSSIESIIYELPGDGKSHQLFATPQKRVGWGNNYAD